MKVMTYTVIDVVGAVAWRCRPCVTDADSAILRYRERAKDARAGSDEMTISDLGNDGYDCLARAGYDDVCCAMGTCRGVLCHGGWY